MDMIDTITQVPLGALVGIDLRTVAWAMAGGCFGEVVGPKVGRLGAVRNYFAASALSALGATGLDRALQIEHQEYVWLLAALFSIGFYPLQARLVKLGVRVVTTVAERWLHRHGFLPTQPNDDPEGNAR